MTATPSESRPATDGSTESVWAPGPAWLFCPADRPDRYAKAAERADVVILDLEDAVAADRKADARAALAAYPGLDPERTIVRVNAAGSPEHPADLALLRELPYRRILLAKTESVDDLAGLVDYEVIVLLESPRGIVHAAQICAAEPVIGVMWGAEDLLAGLGGSASRDADGRYRPVAIQAQSTALLAAKAAGRLAIDAVHVDIGDLDGLSRESGDAVAGGFDAKALIHPSHVPVVRDAFRPHPDQIYWATRVLDGVAEHGSGVFTLDGQMVDGPVVAQARRILARCA